METVVYLTSQKNSTLFDWLEEQYVLNKQLREEMDQEAFLNCVKMDLRNVIAEYLIVDLRIMKHQLPEEVLAGLETFQLLSSHSKVILYIPKEWEMEESIEVLKKFIIFDDRSPVEEQFVALNQDVPKEEPVDEEESGETEVEERIIDMDVLEEELVSTEEEQEILEQEEKVPEEVKVDCGEINVFEKVNQRIKTHEGQPLGKRCVEQQASTSKSKVVKLGADVWSCSNVVVVVAGTERRTGTTTAAMHLCQCLCQHGAKACYSEAVTEENRHLQSIAEEYELEKEDECYKMDDMHLYPDSSYDTEAGYHFIILDVGEVSQRPKWLVSVINSIAQEVVLVTGARKYEIARLNESLELLKGVEERVQILVNGCTGEEYERVQDIGEVVHRGEYEPYLFRSTRAEEEIVKLLREHNE